MSAVEAVKEGDVMGTAPHKVSQSESGFTEERVAACFCRPLLRGRRSSALRCLSRSFSSWRNGLVGIAGNECVRPLPHIAGFNSSLWESLVKPLMDPRPSPLTPWPAWPGNY